MSTKQRGILFSALMVQAILAGRKTQTRRVMRTQPANIFEEALVFETQEFHSGLKKRNGDSTEGPLVFGAVSSDCEQCIESPWEPGDLLYVRETWGTDTNSLGYRYRADDYRGAPDPESKWRPSIHMPKSAARIWLLVESVRVERLQDISDDDAKEEGLAAITKDGGRMYKYGVPASDGLPACSGLDHGWLWAQFQKNPRDAFQNLWQNVYGAESWDASPWVWVVQFKLVSTSGMPDIAKEGVHS